MKEAFGILGWGMFAVIILDMMGFIMWALSGQIPVDGLYIGTITAHVLQLFI